MSLTQKLYLGAAALTLACNTPSAPGSHDDAFRIISPQEQQVYGTDTRAIQFKAVSSVDLQCNYRIAQYLKDQTGTTLVMDWQPMTPRPTTLHETIISVVAGNRYEVQTQCASQQCHGIKSRVGFEVK
jgi:hypothetical protein